jgi:tetratricopeptide (TPR) repeat protein
MWKSLSSSSRSILAALVAIGLVLAGCAPKLVVVDRPSGPVREPAAAGRALPPAPAGEEPVSPTDRSEQPSEPDPRALAALRLTDQAEQSLDARKPDQAIRILERAVNLDPNNGRNFYFLAEAWLMKGVIGQAREFNRLAGIYLSAEDSSWEEKVKRQKERIDQAE